jgi:tRNA-uridine 2-sulfurtransferase
MKKVFVGLSGGVDSGVTAALLKEQGYEVTGVFIETWHPDFLPCTWKDDRREAMRVAAFLDIPFISLDLSKEYESEVGRRFIDGYAKGLTPNPDVWCNRAVKFGGFTKFAKEQGADFVATGHYARVMEKDGTYYLAEGVDPSKDQSYFLWMLRSKDLSRILFPLGGFTKAQVRDMAARFGLPNATRKDSQGICFLGAVDLLDFLGHFMTLRPGPVVNEDKEQVGTHRGAQIYTIGERHGFDVTDPKLRQEPLYVLATDIATNTITVGPKERIPVYTCATLDDVYATSAIDGTLYAASRYHTERIPCTLSRTGDVWEAHFTRPVQITPGQSLVAYKDGSVVAGGTIAICL